MIFKYIFLVLIVEVSVSLSVPDTPSCPQLGCDGAGTFTQDDFKVPITGERAAKWVRFDSFASPMNPQIINYGCVGNSKLLVCPHQQDGEAVHIMLNPDTGVEYDTAGYDTLRNVSMPILTKDNLVFAVNGSHASLVDPINNDSYITKLPMENPQGVHSPIYLPELDFFVIFGNFSTSHSIYKITNGINGMAELDLLTTFTVEKKGKQCPWLPMTEVTTNGNRAYFYAYQIDEIDGIVAVEFMEDHPYYKKIWEVSDEEGSQVLVSSRRHDVMADDNCTVIPQIDPDYSIFPPIDLNTQMLATPDGYVVVTTPVGLLTMQDHGDSGEQVAIALFGAHYISLDKPADEEKRPPIVWMSGWSVYPPFRQFLIAYNYTDLTSGNSIWAISFTEYLGINDLNVTSRITTFLNPEDKNSKVLVFGVSVNNTNPNSTFQRMYCQGCDLGINHLLMAVRSEYQNEATPHIYWMVKTTISSSSDPTFMMRGQIFGIADKLYYYAAGVSSGGVVAIQ